MPVPRALRRALAAVHFAFDDDITAGASFVYRHKDGADVAASIIAVDKWNGELRRADEGIGERRRN